MTGKKNPSIQGIIPQIRVSLKMRENPQIRGSRIPQFRGTPKTYKYNKY
jgi:hypothetical protein